MQGATASFGASIGNLTCGAEADAACNVTGILAGMVLHHHLIAAKYLLNSSIVQQCHQLAHLVARLLDN